MAPIEYHRHNYREGKTHQHTQHTRKIIKEINKFWPILSFYIYVCVCSTIDNRKNRAIFSRNVIIISKYTIHYRQQKLLRVEREHIRKVKKA